jgi:hypothetical protein
MTLLSTPTKAVLAGTAVKGTAKRPEIIRIGARTIAPVAKLGYAVSKPRLRRRARRRAERLGDAAHTVGEVLTKFGPEAAWELGLAERPKPKRTAPRVAAGIVVGAGTMYLLEPGHGSEHRQQLLRLVS